MALLTSLERDTDGSLPSMVIGDFTQGLNSNTDAKDLPLGACRDCENVYFKPGRILKRLGYVLKASLAGRADGVAWFYDSDLNQTLVVWAAGNLYEVDLGDFSVSLIESSCYTSGYRVTWTVLARILYFSDGETIRTDGMDDSGISFYDPVGSPGSAPIVVSSGTTGTIPTPAAKILTTKNGQLLLGRIKYTGGTYAKNSVMWSNVFDPTTILGTNIYPVGEGQGGEINCLVDMSVSSQLNYFDGVFIGMSEKSCYMGKGALAPSIFTAVELPAAVGVLDGATAVYVPSPKSAMVIFLATDRKVYATNGVDVIEISENITEELANWIIDRNTETLDQAKFTAVRNQQNHHYVLDVGGGRHYVYDWDLKCWSKYNRWVNGYWCEAKDSHANPVLYVVDHNAARLIHQNIGTSDNGNPIAPWWTSGYTVPEGDDGDTNKIYKYAYCDYRTDSGTLTLTATVNQGQGASANPMYSPEAIGGSSGSSLWGSGIWGSMLWGESVTVTVTPYSQRRRLFTQMANGSRGKLQGKDLQITVSQATDGWFEVTNINILYLQGGRKHVA